ncbi:positive regulation of cilium movement [Tritrichomonas musculus]|uniref:Positive regulation of cilium movement n=1 Tax=Tritrichomonas musculus TaxID=1915356 RepID=A0ABR2JZS9_9EUKA
MTSLIATGGFIKFETVSEAMKAAGIDYQENNQRGILVWFDNVRDKDFFSSLQPYQIVNRIPSINMICRKAPFVGLIQRVAPLFPEYFTFLPTSFILPLKNQQFIAAVNKKKTRYIVKPDCGSLGKGITIIEPGDTYEPQPTLAIAQEYIESTTLHNTKFDMRIYALVASVHPELTIYVYRDGIARFCSATQDQHNLFSQITNTAVNRQNPDLANVNSITRRVESVFEEMASQRSTSKLNENDNSEKETEPNEDNNEKSEENESETENKKETDNENDNNSEVQDEKGSETTNTNEKSSKKPVDIGALWKRIDNAIVFTIMSATNFILKGTQSSCPSYGLPRCFQILGFDVLLDKDLNPYILEVNFRPSLEYDTEEEKNMKIEMLSQAMKIAAPFQMLQSTVSDRTTPWNDKMWISYLQHNEDVFKRVERCRDLAVKESKFEKVYPTKDPINKDYLRVFNSLKKLQPKMGMSYNLPDISEPPKLRISSPQLKPLITKPVKKRSKSPSRKKQKLLPL